MSELIAALAAFAAPLQQPVHGADRAMKLALIQQRRVDLRGRTILKSFLMKTGQYRQPLGFRECPRRMPLRGHSNRRKTASAPPVPTGSRHRQRLAGWLHTHQRAELIYRG